MGIAAIAESKFLLSHSHSFLAESSCACSSQQKGYRDQMRSGIPAQASGSFSPPGFLVVLHMIRQLPGEYPGASACLCSQEGFLSARIAHQLANRQVLSVCEKEHTRGKALACFFSHF
jgi:hypothetical protein